MLDLAFSGGEFGYSFGILTPCEIGVQKTLYKDF